MSEQIPGSTESMLSVSDADLYANLCRLQTQRIQELEAERNELRVKLQSRAQFLINEGKQRIAELIRLGNEVADMRTANERVVKQRDLCESALRKLVENAPFIPQDGNTIAVNREWESALREAQELLMVIDQLKAIT